MYRFWQYLPNWGEIAIFDRSWYRRVVLERVEDIVSEKAYSEAFNDIVGFERTLTDDRYLIVKFFFHISKAEQKARLKEAEADPREAWRVEDRDRKQNAKYDKYLAAIEETLERTETEWGPWTLVAATDKRWTRWRMFETLVGRMTRRLEDHGVELPTLSRDKDLSSERTESIDTGRPGRRGLLAMLPAIDLSKSLDREAYKESLIDHQLALRELMYKLYLEKCSAIVVVEGWDAAGKGGAIRRLTEKLDPRGYQVYSIAAPVGEDKTHHYLWRFWRRLMPPDEKQLLIFDRSWYGRVLVERVEGFATESEWKRAYREINDFERQLSDHGIVLAKLWFHISSQEQLRRFEARQDIAHKTWKLTDEDWRNRERWNDYESALEDMFRKTSTRRAPWAIVEGNDKYWARVKAQKTLIDAIEDFLEQQVSSRQHTKNKKKNKSKD